MFQKSLLIKTVLTYLDCLGFSYDQKFINALKRKSNNDIKKMCRVYDMAMNDMDYKFS